MDFDWFTNEFRHSFTLKGERKYNYNRTNVPLSRGFCHNLRDILKLIYTEICYDNDAQATEKEQRKRLENIDFILGRLSQSIANVFPETKRFII